MQCGGRGGKPCSYRTLYTCMSPLYAIARSKFNDHSIQTEFAPIFSNILKSSAIYVGNSTKQKRVFDDSDISAMFSFLEDKIEMFKSNRDNKNILLWGRNIAMIAIQLAGCMRASEMLNLKCNDVAFRDDHLQITVQRSKNIDGRLVNIFPQKFYCPIRYLNNYMQISKLKAHFPGFLFRSTKVGERSKLINKKVSYTSYNTMIKRVCVQIGLDPKEYASHSLRRTAATNIIRNGGSSIALKRHGGWKSHAFERYVEQGASKLEKSSLKTFRFDPPSKNDA